MAIVLLHDTLADPKAQPRTFRGLGGKKRFKEAFGVLRFDTGTIVQNGYTDTLSLITAIRAFKHPHFQSTTLRHGLHRISNQVQEDLLQFGGKSQDRAIGIVFLVQCDVIEPQPSRLQL